MTGRKGRVGGISVDVGAAITGGDGGKVVAPISVGPLNRCALAPGSGG
jgi:hypothetical protein